MKKLKLLLAFCALLIGWSNASAQKDVTSTYITNATLSQGMNTGWTVTYTGSGNYSHFNTVAQGNNTVGYATEAYAGWNELAYTAYSMTQSITLPAGNYRLVNYSFFRQGQNADTDKSKSLAYLKAGDKQVAIKTLGSITAAGYANNQAEGANCFDSKMYRNVVEFTSDGSTPIEIGVYGTFDAAYSWCIVGMFELFDLDDAASVSSPTDVTYAITNPGFEYRDLTGWTTEKSGDNKDFWYMNNTALSGKAGIGWVESYQGGGIPNGRSIYQDLTGLDNGLYEVTVYGHLQQGSGSDGFYLYANSDKVAIGSTDKDYSVRTTVTDGNLRIKLGTESCNGNWAAFDKVRLQFYGDPLEAYKELLAQAVSDAIDLKNSAALSSAQKAAWQAVIDANDNDDNAFTEESQFNTAIENINNANTLYQSLIAPYAAFNALKVGANGVAGVEYTETTSGSHSTFTGIISAQSSTANNATTVAAITTATSTLKTAIKTYVNAAEPKNDGEYFDITCLIENPTFENNNATGWSGDVPGFESYQNAEFFNKNFDFYQNITGLANGSYQLSVQAFCRPGDNGNTTSGAYYDYTQGISNITAELYVNSDASTIGNIYSYKDNTTGAKVVGNDYHCNIATDDYWVPNNMKGASLYFADGAYNTTVAALVEDENLKIGFREANPKTNQWVIFDNFRLYYYGSSKLVYYKQYLPQLEAEVTADLSNLAYKSAFASLEYTALEEALEATPASETEEAYKTVIDNIKDAQTAFLTAVSSFNAFNEAKAIEYADDKPYASTTKYAAIATAQAATATSGPDAVTKTNAIYSAYRKYVESNALAEGIGGIDKTNLIEDANFSGVTIAGQTAGAWAFSQTGGTASIFNGESFTDGDGNANYSYFDYNNNGANNQNLSQTLTALPKGQYLLTVTARATSAMDGNYYLSVDFDEKSATEAIPAIGNTGGTFGRGWNDVSVVFNHVSDGDVTIHVYGQNGKAGWSGATRFRLAKIDKEVSITSSIGVATLYTPYALDFEGTGLSAYTATVEVDEVVVTKVDNVQANTGVILKGAQGNYNIPLAASSSTGKGELTGNATEATAWNAFAGYDIYVLALNTSGDAQFQKATSGSVAAGKAFLKIDQGSNVKVFNIVDGTATGVEAPEFAEAEEEEEILYNTAGVRVGKDYKGIVINQKGEKRLQK